MNQYIREKRKGKKKTVHSQQKAKMEGNKVVLVVK
jgi:hypothetical protein